MDIRLKCNPQNTKKTTNILLSNNHTLSEDSRIVIVEDGYDLDMDYDIKIVFKENHLAALDQLIGQLENPSLNTEMILGIHKGAYIPIHVSDITYFSAMNNDTYIHTSRGQHYLTKKKLYQLQEDFANLFFRINKSELVNMKKIKLITPMFKGKLILYLEGYDLPYDVSRGYTKSFKERIGF